MAPKSSFVLRSGAAALDGQESTGGSVSSSARCSLRFRVQEVRRSQAYGIRSSLPFASLSAGVLRTTGLVEKDTGIAFPAEYCDLKRPCPTLLGLGARAKSIVISKVNVYAVGIYADVPAAASVLKKRGQLPTDGNAALITPKENPFDALLEDGHTELSLRLVISSGLINRKRFLDALDERLAPALLEADQSASLEEFRRQFDDVQFKQGLEIAFTQREPGVLVTRIAGQERGVLHSPALCRSLFNIYVGDDPVSKAAKSSALVGLDAGVAGGIGKA